MKTQTHKLEK